MSIYYICNNINEMVNKFKSDESYLEKDILKK